MDAETKTQISNMRLAVSRLQQSIFLLSEIPGMDQHIKALIEIRVDLEEEMAELHSLER